MIRGKPAAKAASILSFTTKKASRPLLKLLNSAVANAKNNLKLEDVAEAINAKSINEYAQYEQAKHLPSFEKFQQFLDAIDPERQRQPIWL